MNDKNIVLTIGLPCYNVSEYIIDCMDSIITQNIKFSYEIICIDDCSIDDTYDILLKLSKKIGNIRIYKNDKNGGISFNRNRIIDESKGKYIWFVDPDDLLFPNVVNHMIDLCERYESDYCCANYVEYKHGEIPNSGILLKQYNAIEKCIEKFGENIIPSSKNQYGAVAASVWCGVWRREFLLKNDISFNTNVFIMEDMLFKLKSEAFYRKVVYINYPIYIYRVRKNSITTSSINKNKKLFISDINFITELKTINHNGNITYLNKINRLIEEAKERTTYNLVLIGDFDFAKKNLKILKEKGYYPYKLRKEIFKNCKFDKNILRKINMFLLPFEPVFWFNCLIRKIYLLIKKR